MKEEVAPLPPIPERRYEHPPVVEALCEIYFTGSQWDPTIPDLFYEEVSTDYPQKSEMAGFGFEVQFGPAVAEACSHPVEVRTRFARSDNSRLLQLGRDVLVVNQLLPYPRYEEWREEVHRAVEFYRKLARPTGINQLGVRYINRVNIPPTAIVNVPAPVILLEDFFHVYPQMPAELGAHGPFMLQLMLSMQSRHQLTLTLGTGPTIPPNALSVLLDLYNVVQLDGQDVFDEFQRLLDEGSPEPRSRLRERNH